MKYLCTHCQKPGISEAAKRWSARYNPAQCAYCGRLSHVIESASSGIMVLTLLMLVAALVAGWAFGAYFVAACMVVLAVAYNVRAWRRAELWPISTESARAANEASWIVVALSALLSISQ